MHNPLIYRELPVDLVPAGFLTRFLPLLEERRWAQPRAGAQGRQVLLLALLKTFQFLGYCPAPNRLRPRSLRPGTVC
jgi:hypothetical protein